VRHLLVAWFTIVIVLLSSRMGILILVSAGIFVAVMHFLKKKFTFRESIFFIFLSGVVSALIFISPVTRFRVVEEPLLTPVEFPSNPRNWNSVNLRFLEWKSGVEGIKDHAIIGTGTGGTLDVLVAHYKKANLGDFNSDYNAHNQYIETYLEIGLLGFISLLLCFLIPFLYAIRNKNRLLASFVIIVALVCLSECFFERGKGIMLYVSFVSLFMFTKKEYGYSIRK
jgi:O-antigen ligase